MTTAAILPMRHSSERVKGKNYRPLGGKELFRHILDTMLETPSIDVVVIDTDSPDIMETCAQLYPQVTVLERPEHLRDGAIAMNDVLLNTINSVEADLYLQTHSTNPFLRSETIEAALQELAASPESDSLFSVTRLQARLWGPGAKALNHDPKVLLRTQDLEPVYLENSCLYLFRGEVLRDMGTRIGARPLMFEVDGVETIDIDEERDWDMAALTYAALHEGASA